METKYLIFMLATTGFIPVATWFGVTYKWAERYLVAGAFFSTAYLIDINFVSMENYRGDTRGFEFGVTDWMILSLLFVMLLSPRWRNKPFTLLPPNGSLVYAYLLMATLSLLVAFVPVYAGFGVMKLVRGITVFIVAYNYLNDEEDLKFVINILAAIVAIEFLVVINQRLSGIYRAPGTTPHSNTLAGYINFINMLFFALLLGNKNYRKPVYWAVLGMGSLMVLATFSRGAIAVMVLGYGLVALLSFKDRMDTSKVRIIVILCLLALPLLAKVGPALIDRFTNAPEESGESRGFANIAALAMANDHLLGVGLNNYSHAINETDYIRFIDNPVDRGIVHNIFLLHACEMGWGGLLVFCLMLLNFLRLGYSLVGKRNDTLVASVAIGITIGMLGLFLQGALEWFFRQTYITIEFFMLAGFLMALPKVQRRIDQKNKLQLIWRALCQPTCHA
ncbi:MAG: O-antigen ligase family protein [Pseudomonadales bacterium]|nr:O-antigen ligase family protein [Pseudomonadales bacterium]MDP4640862.1 O-antigen ligase family protein [Pseudomonadales bacterium]